MSADTIANTRAALHRHRGRRVMLTGHVDADGRPISGWVDESLTLNDTGWLFVVHPSPPALWRRAGYRAPTEGQAGDRFLPITEIARLVAAADLVVEVSE